MQTFKTLAILIFIIFSFQSSFAQDCKYDISETDKFSGKSKVGYWYQLGQEIIYFYKSDGKYSIEMSSYTSGGMQQGIHKGDEGMFRLSDGSFVSFYSNEDVAPVVSVNGAQTNYNSKINCHFDISDENIAKMAANGPLALKVKLGSKEVVKDFNEKKSGKIKTAIQCLINYK